MADYLVEDTVKCDECGSRNLNRDETRGEVVCEDCGLVLEDKVIDQGAEWRVFSPEQGDQRARTGAPMTVMLHDKGSQQILIGRIKIIQENLFRHATGLNFIE
jgi:transcription initiation factor TFIIB